MNTKEVIVWIAALLLLAVVLLSPVACTMSRQAIVAEAIRNGGDPIAVKCAIESSERDSPMCIVKAIGKDH